MKFFKFLQGIFLNIYSYWVITALLIAAVVFLSIQVVRLSKNTNGGTSGKTNAATTEYVDKKLKELEEKVEGDILDSNTQIIHDFAEALNKK